jgi:hypothetical protein
LGDIREIVLAVWTEVVEEFEKQERTHMLGVWGIELMSVEIDWRHVQRRGL